MPLPPEKWQRVREIFEEALKLDPPKRKAFVDESCKHDPELLPEVQSLLTAYQEEDSLVKDVVSEAAGKVTGPLRVGTALGPYRIAKLIGEGGMGAVYLAERDDDAFHKRVAIKVVRGGLDSPKIVQRFMAERRILATLDHPNIASVLDGGSTEDGLPYLVMEYVQGETIDRFCASQDLNLRDRVKLLRSVCRAVEHAHQQLIVHRDLKPANVLVTDPGEPKLLDFGIAKLLDESDGSMHTATEARLLTPEYASPEQIRGNPVTTATDVHALGILLYELLTGRHPFRRGTETPREIEAAVLDRDPEPPSTSVTREVPGQHEHPIPRLNPLELRKELSGDLDNIVLKSLAKEPERRYASAAALGDDLDRYLDNRPVAARPDTFAYRTRKFLRRNPIGVAIAGAFLVTIVSAAVISTRAYLRAESMRVEAETQRDRLKEINSFMGSVFQAASPEKRQSPEEISARDILDTAAAKIETELKDRPEVAVAVQTEIGRRYNDLGFFEKSQEYLEQAVAGYTQLEKLDTPEALTAQVYLADAFHDQAKYDEAVAVLVRACDLAKDLGPDHFDIKSSALRMLSRVYLDQGDREKAAPLLEELLVELDQEPIRSLPGVLEDRADTANDLGLLRVRQARYEEAEPLLRLAIELRTQLRGEDHSETGEMWANLAYALNRAGDYEEALVSARRALAIHVATLGEDHLETANSRINLADALVNLGELEEAESHYPLVLEAYSKSYGEDHPRIGTVYNNMALALLNGGAPEEAIPKFEEAARIYGLAFGDEHAWTAIARHNIVRALRGAKRLDEAEQAGRANLAVRKKIFEGDHPDIVRSLTLLSAILRDQDAAVKAELLAREAVVIGERSLPPNSPVRLSASRELSTCMAKLGLYDEAEAILVAAHTMSDSARGGDDKLTVSIAEQLAKLREKESDLAP
ncbi:MAG: serine/threonine protein kinase [Candidatus Eisenbacteria bacterium]|uniref:Serine/threonine protein kinase n=1 Tax=Eiseniibacteriota bacterium TaxID=2212470 RepID=A0A7Y2E8V5_UNCEI|nr:serine/threonine protein kinase [Candidatus Eisenbacteria bacterium]